MAKKIKLTPRTLCKLVLEWQKSINDQLKYIATFAVALPGGAREPIGLKSMQNRTFLVLLRPIFAQKTKIW